MVRKASLPEDKSRSIVKKLHRSYTRKTRGLRIYDRDERKLNIENLPCRRWRRMKDLSLEDKIQIAFEVIVLNKLFDDISKTHNVKVALIQSIASKLKHKQAFLRELRAKRDHKEQCEVAIKRATASQLSEGILIENSRQIMESVKEDDQLDVSESLVRDVLKHHLGMKYKKIKRVMYTANREKNLVLRFEYSKVMIKCLQDQMRVINVDETWIGESDFRRLKWQVKEITNSAPEMKVQPRITLISAIDNFGRTYHSFIQANSNVQVMRLYLTHLAAVLDEENQQWRKNTLVLLDGAKYHLNHLTQQHCAFLGMKLIYSGPQSYDTAPAELLFSMIKRTNLNP